MSFPIPGLASGTGLIFLSPHYDDLALTWGGLLQALAPADDAESLRLVQVFSRSIYQARDHAGNRDISDARIQYATGIRLVEELNCLDDMLGRGRYVLELMGERECVLRARPWKEGEEFEFPQGTRESFNAEEMEIFARLKRRFAALLRRPATAVFAPLCVKEHVDHVMVRDALIEAAGELGPARLASVYFGEDQPYAGLASEADWAKAGLLINALGLEALDYDIDLDQKVRRAMSFYPSQVEESYRKGLLQRARQLAGAQGGAGAMERVYRWKG